jgi:hypothetical protein
MTTSWRNGLGFCAIIHHFCPELIDFASLEADDVFGNNELAFSVAEQHLGIPSLLDPQDMVECELLDRLSILTYLAQYFQAFNSLTVQTRIRRVGAAISKSSSTSSELADSGSGGSPGHGSWRRPPLAGRLHEPCRTCALPVEIISRLHVGGRILHRTCFRCARCNTQLSLASYYETETGEFCCEVCPDEEKKEAVTLRANKDLAGLMSADSGHSSDEEEEMEVDMSVTSGHTVAETVASTDFNDNIAEESDNAKEEGEADNKGELCQKRDGSPDALHDNLDTNPSNEAVQDIVVEFISNASFDDQSNVDETVDLIEDIMVLSRDVDSDNKSEKVEVEEKEYPDHNNPFGDDNEEDSSSSTVQPSVANVVKETEVEKPKEKEVSTNPFGSDVESDDDGSASKATQSYNPNFGLNPFGSDLSDEEGKSPSLSVRSATRKKRRAPLPPGTAAPVPAPRPSLLATPGPLPHPRGGTAKRLKDADNLHRRSQILESIHSSPADGPPPASTIPEDAVSVASDTASLRSSTVNSAAHSSQLSVSMFSNIGPDKADEGQWRKKKGPAPARPIPPKRTVRKLARKAINQELIDIEVKQGELERQGVKLEKTIREICAASDAEEGANRDSLGPEAEDLIIQLFDLVNEKNELFRRQTELIYMKKENRLEEQHADCEYQIRVMMSKPECQRTEDDKRKEDKLISKLVEIVGLRNEIVDCLEMDRLREIDEDTAIEDHMSNYAAVKPAAASKKGGLEKILKMKKKKKKDKDSEKDIDTSELDNLEARPEKKKKSTKKKIMSLASKGLASSKQLAFPHKN